jgi:hypothetical protein
MTIAPNRAVAVLTPLVFAPLAGSISVLAARYVPGVEIDSGSIEAIFIAGAGIAFAKAGIWLKGWQEHEQRQETSLAVPEEPDLDDDESDLEADHEPDLDVDDEPDLELDDDDDDDLSEPTQPVAAGAAG